MISWCISFEEQFAEECDARNLSLLTSLWDNDWSWHFLIDRDVSWLVIFSPYSKLINWALQFWIRRKNDQSWNIMIIHETSWSISERYFQWVMQAWSDFEHNLIILHFVELRCWDEEESVPKGQKLKSHTTVSGLIFAREFLWFPQGRIQGQGPGCLGPRTCRKRPHFLGQLTRVPICPVEGLDWGP